MNSNLEKIIKKGKHLKLSEAEKRAMRETLSFYVRANPVPENKLISIFQMTRVHATVFSAVILFFLSGSASVLAEKSLPGDFLYPLKTGVNENVMGLFAVSTQAKAQLEVNLAERRLSEVEHISKQPNIPESVTNQLFAQIDEHVQRASEEESSLDDDTNNTGATSTNSPSVRATGSSQNLPALNSTTLHTSAVQKSSFQVSVNGNESAKSKSDSRSTKQKITDAENKVTELKSQRNQGKNLIRAQIELISARRELFRNQKNDSVNTSSNETENNNFENKIHEGDIKQIENLQKVNPVNIAPASTNTVSGSVGHKLKVQSGEDDDRFDD
jgi:hypothetical protein